MGAAGAEANEEEKLLNGAMAPIPLKLLAEALDGYDVSSRAAAAALRAVFSSTMRVSMKLNNLKIEKYIATTPISRSLA